MRRRREPTTVTKSTIFPPRGCENAKCSTQLLRIAWSLAIAAHDFDFIGLHRLARVLHLERNVFDQECPDLVAKSVGIEMAL